MRDLSGLKTQKDGYLFADNVERSRGYGQLSFTTDEQEAIDGADENMIYKITIEQMPLKQIEVPCKREELVMIKVDDTELKRVKA